MFLWCFVNNAVQKFWKKSENFQKLWGFKAERTPIEKWPERRSQLMTVIEVNRAKIG